MIQIYISLIFILVKVRPGPNLGLARPGALSLWGTPTPGYNGPNFRTCDIYYHNQRQGWGVRRYAPLRNILSEIEPTL